MNRGQSFSVQRVLHDNPQKFALPADDLSQVKGLDGSYLYQFARVERSSFR